MLQGTQRRYDGLLSAIDKMEQSIRRDRYDLDFQNHKINTTEGQLEAQLRQAKLKMIEERVNSKEEKLNEMNTTKVDLEKRLVTLKEKEARRAAQEAVKEKIVVEMKAAAEAREDVAEKLDKAGEEISAAKAKEAPKAKAPKKEESVLGVVGVMMGESFEDVIDTVKAVASVIGDKIGDAIEELKEDIAEATAPDAEATAETPVAETPTAEAEPVVAEAPVEPAATVKSDEEE